MADLSQLSDADLAAAYHAALAQPETSAQILQRPSPPIAGPGRTTIPVAPGIEEMSDEDLQKLYAAIPPDQVRGLAADAKKEMTGAAREAALPASYAAKGVLDTLGVPGSIAKTAINQYSKYIGTPFAQTFLGDDARPISGDNPWTSEGFLNWGRSAGLIDRPDLVPHGAREELEAAAAQGAGASLPYAMLPGATLARTLAGGAGGGAGAEFGKDLAPDHPYIAPLAGALLGMGAGNAGFTLAGKAANLARGEMSPVAESYYRMQVDPRLAGDVSENAFLRGAQAYAMKSPGGAGVMERAAEPIVGQFGDAVERTAQKLGASTTAQQAGQALQDEARTWFNTTRPQIEAQAWDPVNKAVPFYTPTPLTNYEKALTDIVNRAGRLQETTGTLLPPKAQQLLSSLQNDLGGMPATWEEAQRVRSLIGEARGVPEISQSIGTQNLNRIYAGLSDDMRAAARSQGAEAVFDAANGVSTRLHAFTDNVLSKIISSPRNPLQEGIAPETAAQNVLGAGDSVVSAIRQNMPRGADELGAYVLRRSALANPGAQDASGALVSPGTFVTNINKMRKDLPDGTNALLGGVNDDLHDLLNIGESMKKTGQFVNTSNTATHQAFGHMAAAVLGGAEAGREFGGIPGAAIGAAVGGGIPLAGGNLLARGLTNPGFSRYISTPVAPYDARQRLIQALAPVRTILENGPTERRSLPAPQ